jgi:hypothetical protein
MRDILNFSPDMRKSRTNPMRSVRSRFRKRGGKRGGTEVKEKIMKIKILM